MGFTPLEGLVMGTRCGDIDPAIPLFLITQAGYNPDEVGELLNRNSGLKGLCGENDMREVLRLADEGDERADLALSLFCYRIRKYIGAYFAILGRLDALVFTAGIGEYNPEIRRRCCKDLQHLGIGIDATLNQEAIGKFADISPAGAQTRVLVIPTDEELEIAHATRDCLAKT
jgi:acetate kinase